MRNFFSLTKHTSAVFFLLLGQGLVLILVCHQGHSLNLDRWNLAWRHQTASVALLSHWHWATHTHSICCAEPPQLMLENRHTQCHNTPPRLIWNDKNYPITACIPLERSLRSCPNIAICMACLTGGTPAPRSHRGCVGTNIHIYRYFRICENMGAGCATGVWGFRLSVQLQVLNVSVWLLSQACQHPSVSTWQLLMAFRWPAPTGGGGKIKKRKREKKKKTHSDPWNAGHCWRTSDRLPPALKKTVPPSFEWACG